MNDAPSPICVFSNDRPAGLKKTADPSGHGAATPVTPRPMAHPLCSYTANPWADAPRPIPSTHTRMPST